MKSRHLVLAAVLISSGWSSQVAYKKYLSKVELRAQVSRSIASQLEQLSHSNIEIEAEEIKNLSKKLIQSKEALLKDLRNESLKDLIHHSKEQKIKDIKKVKASLSARLEKAELFIAKAQIDVRPAQKEDTAQSIEVVEEADKVSQSAQIPAPPQGHPQGHAGGPPHHPDRMDGADEEQFQESDHIDDSNISEIAPPKEESKPEVEKKTISREIRESIAASRKTLDEFNIVDFELKVDEAISVVMEEKSVEQDTNLAELNSRVCSQNEKIESLTEKLEKLLEDKEKVVKEMDDKKENSRNENGMMNPYLFPSMFMSPSQFFSQGFSPMSSGPDYSFLNQSQGSSMGGMDMNFLMLTSLLGQSSGFGALGGGTNLNYSPVYNQNYSVPSSFINSGDGNTMAMQMPQGMQNHQNQQMMSNPFAQNQTMDQNQVLPTYPRSNGLQTNNTSTHMGMGIGPNAQKL